MGTYIATFFSHIGAVRFGRTLRALGVEHVLMPVPRRVSSSCGTCVRFTAAALPPLEEPELEALYRQQDEIYQQILSNL